MWYLTCFFFKLKIYLSNEQNFFIKRVQTRTLLGKKESTLHNSLWKCDSLKDMCEMRWKQSSDSSHQMDYAFTLILEYVLPEHGYHRNCYNQRFTMNINPLSKPQETTKVTSSRLTRCPAVKHFSLNQIAYSVIKQAGTNQSTKLLNHWRNYKV